MSSLKPGDLALIIKSADGLSVGKIVTCVQIEFIHQEYGTIWLVQSANDDLVTIYGGIGNNVHIPASWLMKIPNDPLPDETLEKEKEMI